VRGFAVDDAMPSGADELRLSDIFRDLPVAVLKARPESAAHRVRKRVSA
jgi:hypothetical protein